MSEKNEKIAQNELIENPNEWKSGLVKKWVSHLSGIPDKQQEDFAAVFEQQSKVSSPSDLDCQLPLN